MKYWIARDKDNMLYLYEYEPKLAYSNAHYFDAANSECYDLPIGLFPEVTFENSPQEVEIKLVSEIVGVKESPSKTFSRVNMFEVGASYRR